MAYTEVTSAFVSMDCPCISDVLFVVTLFSITYFCPFGRFSVPLFWAKVPVVTARTAVVKSVIFFILFFKLNCKYRVACQTMQTDFLNINSLCNRKWHPTFSYLFTKNKLYSDHWLLLYIWIIYCFLHSVLAASKVKLFFEKISGRFFRYYRLAYSILATITLVFILYF